MNQGDLSTALEALKTFVTEEASNRSRPRKVVAFFAAKTLGEFVLQNVVAAGILQRFPEAYVAALFKDAPPFRRFIAECNPYIHSIIATDAAAPMTIPVDWFDLGTFAPVKSQLPEWGPLHLNEPDLVLLPGQLSQKPAWLEGFAEAPPLFRLPPEREGDLLDALEQTGLDPNRWFAALCTEGDAPPYGELTCHIAESQGGRVVLIGPEMPFELQAAALSRARYALGNATGPLVLAGAFGVPCAATGMVDPSGAVWGRESVVLPGNDARDLMAVADHMFKITSGCPGWREAQETPPSTPEKGGMPFPWPLRDKPLLTFWE